MFDNANNNLVPNGVNQTRGLEFSLNLSTKSATLLKNFVDPTEPLFASSQGSYSPLANENVLMGYGNLSVIKEFSAAGCTAMTIQFGELNTTMSYRSFRLPWTAVPAADPVAVASGGKVFMSWNGATNVTSWDIYEGKTATGLVKTQTIAKSGFESNTTISNKTAFVQVGAYDGGNFLRNSSVVSIFANGTSIGTSMARKA
jgi:hypothetical protein